VGLISFGCSEPTIKASSGLAGFEFVEKAYKIAYMELHGKEPNQSDFMTFAALMGLDGMELDKVETEEQRAYRDLPSGVTVANRIHNVLRSEEYQKQLELLSSKGAGGIELVVRAYERAYQQVQGRNPGKLDVTVIFALVAQDILKIPEVEEEKKATGVKGQIYLRSIKRDLETRKYRAAANNVRSGAEHIAPEDMQSLLNDNLVTRLRTHDLEDAKAIIDVVRDSYESKVDINAIVGQLINSSGDLSGRWAVTLCEEYPSLVSEVQAKNVYFRMILRGFRSVDYHAAARYIKGGAKHLEPKYIQELLDEHLIKSVVHFTSDLDDFKAVFDAITENYSSSEVAFDTVFEQLSLCGGTGDKWAVTLCEDYSEYVS
jgi:hypothetical protein